MRPDRSVFRRHLDDQMARLDPAALARPRGGWLKAIREALGMTAGECAMRLGISAARVGQIERAEVEGSLQMSTMMRTAAALHSRFLYVVRPEVPLEDLVLRQAYHQALEELSLPVPTALNPEDTPIGPWTEDQLEIRTLELVDRRGLWRKRRVPNSNPS